jgi:hypothetical protein
MPHVPPEFPASLSDDLAKYIAGNFGAYIERRDFARPPASEVWEPDERDAIRELVRANTPVEAAELKMINAFLKPLLEEQVARERTLLPLAPLGLVAIAIAVACVSQLVSLLVFGSTLGQRIFGYAVLDKRGEPAGRGRMLWRWCIVWLPLVAAIWFAFFRPEHGSGAAMHALRYAKLALWLMALMVAVGRPERGIHDEIAGTRIVPR